MSWKCDFWGIHKFGKWQMSTPAHVEWKDEKGVVNEVNYMQERTCERCGGTWFDCYTLYQDKYSKN